jgi:hypothetical protein
MKFYQPTTKSGIIDLIYRNTGADSNSYPLADVTADVNLALDNAIDLAIKACGNAQFDDTNHTKQPIIYFNLVSGQRDYSAITDEQGNLILDYYRVMVADEAGVYYDLEKIDQQTKGYKTMGMVDGQNITGKPSKYDQTGSSIFLDAIPNYSYTAGIKCFINREGSHFSVPTVNVADDTVPGIDGRLHEYLATRPTAYYASRKVLKSANFWANELLKYEGDEDRGITGKIEGVYSKRMKDEPTRIITKHRSSR